jgi:hypothetical protein
MSAIDERTVDPARPHPSTNMGHEMSDFSWTTVLWLLPISVIALVAFTLVCLYWFRGAKDTHVVRKEAMFSTAELGLHRAKESEFLNQYKYLDKQAGRVRIPIQRAMELVVQESQGKGRVDWTPAADAYNEGAAFARPSTTALSPHPTTGSTGDAKAPAEGPASVPAQDAAGKISEPTAPGGGAGVEKGTGH